MCAALAERVQSLQLHIQNNGAAGCSRAAEGMRFTQFYAGATVCAPSRSVLMTGLHTGHTRVRGNSITAPERQMLRTSDVTLAEVLRDAGYATGLVGKWGLGQPGDEGMPTEQGFDHFFGFLDQVRAHQHYPDYVWRNETKVPLPNVVVPVGLARSSPAPFRITWVILAMCSGPWPSLRVPQPPPDSTA